MSELVTAVALVEGPSEQIFIKNLVAPHLATRNILLTPIVISKPGQKGGDVRFERVINDIELHLKQRPDTYLTLFLDYYGIKGEWPGLAESLRLPTPAAKASHFGQSTSSVIVSRFGEYRPAERFIPYVSMHEFESLLFSSPEILAANLRVKPEAITQILNTCGQPEAINSSRESAPSKRLDAFCAPSRFKKTTSGISIASSIGLPRIREACPLFNAWITRLETLTAI